MSLPERRARVMLLDMATGYSTDVIVSIDAGAVLSTTVLDGSAGQLPILIEEFDAVADIVNADPRWAAALERRGTTADDVKCVPLSGGHYNFPEEEGRRMLRVLAFRQDYPGDHVWAHPVDGLSAYVDTASRTITRLIDSDDLPIPAESGNFDDPAVQGPPLTTLKPIVITQPEGPSFTVDGDVVSWANWKFQVGFDVREGLVLRQLSFTDAGEERPVIYRASIDEMLVPYGDPSPVRFWQNYFDTGEYLFGRFTNSLALGCDCVGEIKYFDATMADETGNPFTVKNGICMHEEDFGTLWKHTDIYTDSNEVRRSRRLVISLLHHRRQLRLRVLLVPLPRRHHRVRGEAHRHPVHVGVPGAVRRRLGLPLRVRGRARARRPVPPAPVLGPARHDGRRALQRRRRDRGRPGSGGAGRTNTATRSPRSRPASRPRRSRGARRMHPSPVPGTSSTPRRPTEWAGRPGTRCTRRTPRRCWRMPRHRSRRAPSSRPSTCS